MTAETEKKKKRKAHHLLPLLLILIVSTSVLAIGVAFVPAFRSALLNMLGMGTKPATSETARPASQSTSKAPESVASNEITSGAASNVLAGLKVQQGKVAYTFTNVIAGSSGNSASRWKLTNRNTAYKQQAFIYEFSDGCRGALIGETPVVDPGQAATEVKWYKPLSGATRTVCALIYTYKLGGQQATVNTGFAKEITLYIK